MPSGHASDQATAPRRQVNGISHLPVQLKGLGANVTFATTHLTVLEHSLICCDLYRGNAHQFLRIPMHSNV